MAWSAYLTFKDELVIKLYLYVSRTNKTVSRLVVVPDSHHTKAARGISVGATCIYVQK